MALRLKEEDAARIRRHGEETYPAECCGFLIGRISGEDREVMRVAEARNQRADSPRNRYLISPEAYLQVEREAEGAGLEVLGFYHSHPDAEPRPSEFDRSHALSGCSYVIVAVERGKAGELRAWVLAEDRSVFASEPIRGGAPSSPEERIA